MDNPLVIFDGVCNLCDSIVQFIIKRDKNRIFRFTSFQSEFAKPILKKFDIENIADKSVILIHKENCYLKSNAVLRILIMLNGNYKYFAIMMLFFPKMLRDCVYNLISTKRYKWLGKKENCLIPNAELNDRYF